MALRRRRSLATAAAVLAVVGGAGSAYAAWGATTGPPAAAFASNADWTAPAASAIAIQKGGTTTPGYANSYVKPGGQYYVYSQVADIGNPASGIASSGGVTANLVNVTSGQSAAALSSGSFTSMGASYNYRAGPFTVSAAAGSRLYTLTTKDTAGNTAVTPSQTVVVDGTAPSGSDIQTTPVAGGTTGKAEAGDKLTLTFSEPIDPDSLLSGWDGSSRNITLRIVNGNPSDTIQLFDGGTRIAAIGTITLPAKTYVTANVDFTSSPMVLSGSTLTVTLGSTTGGASVTTGGAGATKWIPTATLYDRAGNKLTSSTVTETGASDAEF